MFCAKHKNMVKPEFRAQLMLIALSFCICMYRKANCGKYRYWMKLLSFYQLSSYGKEALF